MGKGDGALNEDDAARAVSADPEAVLLAKYGAGDPGAAAELARLLAPRLLGFATRQLGDKAEAEDIVQETMLRLWKIAATWQPGGAKVSTWAFRVAANLCTDRRRRTGRQKATDPSDFDQLEDSTPGQEAKIARQQRAAALEAALLELPERQRQAVILRHIEGLPNPEIAAVMEIGVEAVESLTARGKRSLSARLLPKREQLGLDDG
ncbi:MAG: sigma-70 family RNA polymerase sigma factor [Pseudomonadota bacterium]